LSLTRTIDYHEVTPLVITEVPRQICAKSAQNSRASGSKSKPMNITPPVTSQIVLQVISIDAKQAAKIAALMALIAVLAATYPLAGAAWALSVHLPRKHFMFLLFIPFFYALATYFLVGLGCVLYNFAARTVGGIRIEIAEHAHDTVEDSTEKPERRRQAA